MNARVITFYLPQNKLKQRNSTFKTKEQFLEAHQVYLSDDDQSMGSTTPLKNILAGEGQDEEEDAKTVEDYWEAMTEAMFQKLAKDKGKKKST